MSEEGREYYEKTVKESRELIAEALPRVARDVLAAVVIWFFAKLVFVPIAGSLQFRGYPVSQILNLIIVIALAVIVVNMLVNIRRLIDGAAGYAACRIGAPYDVSPEEVEHYKTALRGIFYIIVVSLIYLLFVEFLSRIHPALSAVTLIAIVIWAIYMIWKVVQSISAEIGRYTTKWAERI